MTDSNPRWELDELEPTEAELREAEQLARALEGRAVPRAARADLPTEALAMAALLRAPKAGELSSEARERARSAFLDPLPAPAPKARRGWWAWARPQVALPALALLAAGLGALALAWWPLRSVSTGQQVADGGDMLAAARLPEGAPPAAAPALRAEARAAEPATSALPTAAALLAAQQRLIAGKPWDSLDPLGRELAAHRAALLAQTAWSDAARRAWQTSESLLTERGEGRRRGVELLSATLKRLDAAGTDEALREDGYFQLARLAQTDGSTDEAASYVERGLAIRSVPTVERANLFILRAQLEHGRGQVSEAARSLLEAQRINEALMEAELEP